MRLLWNTAPSFDAGGYSQKVACNCFDQDVCKDLVGAAGYWYLRCCMLQGRRNKTIIKKQLFLIVQHRIISNISIHKLICMLIFGQVVVENQLHC